MPASTITQWVTKVKDGSISKAADILAAEEPLEISLEYGPATMRILKSLSITMRTPGNDDELATGFLFTEGIINYPEDILSITSTGENTIIVSLYDTMLPDTKRLDRHFYTTSSCGVCGKASLDAVLTQSIYQDVNSSFLVSAAIIYSLPDTLRRHQELFDSTGGLHASALFTPQGELLLMREDVGRHNALDKLIGYTLSNKRLPLHDAILLLSGRASFELIQKASMAGIRLVAAVGAPSSLAVKLAEDCGITLIGFLRGQRFNIYTGKERLIL